MDIDDCRREAGDASALNQQRVHIHQLNVGKTTQPRDVHLHEDIEEATGWEVVGRNPARSRKRFDLAGAYGPGRGLISRLHTKTTAAQVERFDEGVNLTSSGGALDRGGPHRQLAIHDRVRVLGTGDDPGVIRSRTGGQRIAAPDDS